MQEMGPPPPMDAQFKGTSKVTFTRKEAVVVSYKNSLFFLPYF